GGSSAGDQARRYRVDSAWREALAWGERGCRHEPYRVLRSARWQDGGLDGAGHRRTIQALIATISQGRRTAIRAYLPERNGTLHMRRYAYPAAVAAFAACAASLVGWQVHAETTRV